MVDDFAQQVAVPPGEELAAGGPNEKRRLRTEVRSRRRPFSEKTFCRGRLRAVSYTHLKLPTT
jgi:hypothetical protein